MVNQKWTVGDQETYLQGLIPSFVEHKAANKLTLFWNKLYNEWFDKYPAENARFAAHPEFDVGTPQEVRSKKIRPMKDRLREWFNSRTRVRPAATGSQEILDLSGRKPRMLQLQHAYIHLYYDERIAPVHESEYAAHILATPEGQKPTAEVTFRDRVAARMVKNETDDVKKQCEDYRRMLVAKGMTAKAARQAGLAVGMKDASNIDEDGYDGEHDNGTEDAAETKRLASAAEIQKNINALPGSLACILRTIFEKTGWRGLILLGGPEPEHGGKLQSYALSTGATMDLGQSFETYHHSWKESVEDVFADWLVKSFPLEERQKVSLTSTLQLANTSSTRHHPGVTPPTSQAHVSSITSPSEASAETASPIVVSGVSVTPSTRSSASGPPPLTTSTIPPAPIVTAGTSSVAPTSSITTTSSVTPTSPVTPALSVLHPSSSDPTNNDISTNDSGTNANTNLTTSASQPDVPPAVEGAASHIATRAPITPNLPTNVQSSTQPRSHTNAGSADCLALNPPVTVFKDAWNKDAHAFMDTHLTFHGAVPVVDTWISLETILGPRATNKSKLSLVGRPAALEWWYKNGRNFARVPESTKFPNMGQDTLGWYISLSPARRGTTWPLLKSEDIRRDEEWEGLAVGGKYGLVVLLICMTWWGMKINTLDERQLFISVLEDMGWAFSAMLDKMKSNDSPPTMQSKPKMKRTNKPHLDTPVPKRRRTNKT